MAAKNQSNAKVKAFENNDYFLLIIVCHETQEVLLQSRKEGNDVSCECKELPSIMADRLTGSWKSAAKDMVEEILDKAKIDKGDELMDRIQLIRISRFWYPLAGPDESMYLQRFVLFLPLISADKPKVKASSEYSWVTIDRIGQSGLLDPEMTEVVRKTLKDPNAPPPFVFREYNKDSFLTDPDVEIVPETKKIQTILTKAANVSMDDQRLLYRQFLNLTFPKLFMTLGQYVKLMVTLGWNRATLKDLFRCFNTRRSGVGGDSLANFLSFSEVLCGLCALEPDTPHGDQAGEARCRYIFRFYKHNPSPKLTFDEFCAMVRDIREAKGFSTDEEDVEKEARASSKVFGCEENNHLSLHDFLTGVGQLKFRGTSYLMRSHDSVFALLRNQEEGVMAKMSRQRKRCRPQPPDDPSVLSFDHAFDDDDEGMSIASNDSSFEPRHHDAYDFATHVVKVKRSGQVVDVKSLWEMDVPEAVTPSYANSQKNNFGRLMSIRAFSLSSEANEMLVALRYFERASKLDGNEKEPLSWGRVDMATFGRSLIELCQHARGLLIQEPRLIKLSSPTYILGDLHGNFRDLVCFEKVLWRMTPKLSPANFLFLGDYVDRGAHGVEVVAYLFAQKIVAPTKFHLLRGNHESRTIQKNFTFHSECLAKFGDDLGNRVWEEVNLVFDVMPIAAVIDRKIFCVHGGIPPPWLGTGFINSLDKVNKDLPNPDSEELVWEYMWNDPLPADLTTLSEEAGQQLARPEQRGFVDNYRRGTGHMFSDAALDDFLKRNKLSHVIRAHEVKRAGFQVQHHQKLLTVFSSSQYCSGTNEAACALADSGKLRLIRLDTS